MAKPQRKPEEDPWSPANLYAALEAEEARRNGERMMYEALNNAEQVREESKKFLGFVKHAWPILHPATPLVIGWAIEAIIEHLEYVTTGEIQRLLINVPPGLGKPVNVREQIMTSTGYKRLADIKVGDKVLTHRGRFRDVIAVHEQGVLPNLEIRTFSGREVRTAPDHPFLTPNGWVQAKDLVAGDYVGFPHRTEAFTPDTIMPDEEARLLGYLIGDGNISYSSMGFTNADRSTIDDFIHCAKACGFYAYEKKHVNPKVQASYVVFKSGLEKVKKGQNRALQWLESHGLAKTNSYTKFVPSGVFNGGESAMRNFLGAYWSCAGTIGIRHTGNKTTMVASATTVSLRLAKDVQRLTTALNIDMRLRTKTVKLKSKKQGDNYTSFNVLTSNRNEVAKMADLQGLIQRKNLKALTAFRDRFDPHIYEDEVISVCEVEPGECRCITVDEDQSFTAGNLIVHNSILTNVFMQAYEWGPLGKPHLHYLSTSGDEDIVNRDAKKFRELVTSPWYQTLWPDVTMTSTGIGEMNNSKTGARFGRPWSSQMGFRGHRFIGDDPHNLKNEKSDAMREETVRLFKEGSSSRVTDMVRDAHIIICQRVGPNDLSGYIIENDPSYVYMMLPQEFDRERKCITYGKSGRKLFEDPRKKDGELLFPERMPRAVVEKEKSAKSGIGAYAYASQHLQNPIPRGGGLFQRDWFKDKILKPWELEKFEIVRTVRYWDLADTDLKALQKTGARTAGVKMAITKNRDFIVLGAKAFGLSGAKKDAEIKKVCKGDDRKVETFFPQDPAAGGKVMGRAMISLLAGRVAKLVIEKGDKVARAEPYASQCEAGNVYLLEGDWNEEYITELDNFPNAPRKDLVDASSGAFGELLKRKARDPMQGLASPIFLEAEA